MMREVHTIDPSKTTNRELYHHLVHAVGPRPIAFASTVDEVGNINLSPFSFFNVFSAHPPILIFSPVLRGRDGSKKDTLSNVEAVPQVVINMVNYEMAEQMSLTSAEFPSNVSEFGMAGFTTQTSVKVKPPRVAESPVSFECQVSDVLYLNNAEPGSGVLVVAEVVLMHVMAQYLDGDGRIACERLDLIGRMGGNWYTRAFGDALFQVKKPASASMLGFDGLPKSILESSVLTGSDLAKLASLSELPESSSGLGVSSSNVSTHREAQKMIKQGKVMEAMSLLLDGPDLKFEDTT